MLHNHEHHDTPDPNHADNQRSAIEEPLDPANQSLADALRASFGVLKIIMIFIIIIYLFSGFVIVDQKEVRVLTRFGRQVGPPLEPGLHFAFPYPIDETERVETAPKTMLIDDFWLSLRDTEKISELSDLPPRGGGLNPAVDGALITGDKALMHFLCHVQYRINDANDYVRNVQNDRTLIKWVIQNAAVAEAARMYADDIWKEAGTLAEKIQQRAQKILDALESGILIENVAADQSYYPLQTKKEFEDVGDAENKKRERIQEAEAERARILNGVAGPAWEKLNDAIQRLDQIEEGPAKEAVIEEIEEILVSKAAGVAGGLIKLAERDRSEIIASAQAEANAFSIVLERYRKNPELWREQLRQKMLDELYDEIGVSKWLLPPGEDKQIMILLNTDPKAAREVERAKRLKELGEENKK
ncbi:MAG: hypothetical protein JSV03_02280 [Planctomycetota bacterium]|nr:MAG: hypothetical protein JSV03_02280 [Planctomycetota bacterium]